MYALSVVVRAIETKEKILEEITEYNIFNGIALVSEKDDKRSYEVEFKAEKGKLK